MGGNVILKFLPQQTIFGLKMLYKIERLLWVIKLIYYTQIYCRLELAVSWNPVVYIMFQYNSVINPTISFGPYCYYPWAILNNQNSWCMATELLIWQNGKHIVKLCKMTYHFNELYDEVFTIFVILNKYKHRLMLPKFSFWPSNNEGTQWVCTNKWPQYQI